MGMCERVVGYKTLRVSRQMGLKLADTESAECVLLCHYKEYIHLTAFLMASKLYSGFQQPCLANNVHHRY